MNGSYLNTFTKFVKIIQGKSTYTPTLQNKIQKQLQDQQNFDYNFLNIACPPGNLALALVYTI